MNPDYKVNDPLGWGGNPQRGAAMGRPSVHRDGYRGALQVSCAYLTRDGYDQNGTYFGTGEPLFWVHNADLSVDFVIRASGREAATRAVFVLYPDATIELSEEGYLDDMVQGYLSTILFAENDESTEAGGDPLDKNYDIDDFAPEAVERARADCEAFVRAVGVHALADPYVMGSDFWFDRAGHGVGFADRDYPDEQEKALCDAAQKAGDRNVYVGDDKKIYVE